MKNCSLIACLEGASLLEILKYYEGPKPESTKRLILINNTGRLNLDNLHNRLQRLSEEGQVAFLVRFLQILSDRNAHDLAREAELFGHPHWAAYFPGGRNGFVLVWDRQGIRCLSEFLGVDSSGRALGNNQIFSIFSSWGRQSLRFMIEGLSQAFGFLEFHTCNYDFSLFQGAEIKAEALTYV